MQSRYYDPAIGRFINADALVSTGQGVLGNNMFAYCNNDPTNRVDYAGERAEIYNGDLAGYGGGGVAGLGFSFVWLIQSMDTLTTTYDERQDNHNNVLSAVQAYAKTISGPDEKYVVHHIVAQNDYRAADARAILLSVGIHPKTNGLNLAVIPASKHFSMHTQSYYNYIDSRFRGLEDNTSAVIFTLVELQFEIQIYCQTGWKVW